MNIQSNSPVTPETDVATSAIAILQSMLDRRRHIDAALRYTEGTHTFDDVVVMVLNGRLLWWPLADSFMLTEVVEYPKARHLNVFLAGGDLDEIRGQQDNLINVARLQNCSALTLSGRRGWIKALATQGWRESHSAMILALDEDKEHG